MLFAACRLTNVSRQVPYGGSFAPAGYLPIRSEGEAVLKLYIDRLSVPKIQSLNHRLYYVLKPNTIIPDFIGLSMRFYNISGEIIHVPFFSSVNGYDEPDS
jgi:hypothetical protein